MDAPEAVRLTLAPAQICAVPPLILIVGLWFTFTPTVEVMEQPLAGVAVTVKTVLLCRFETVVVGDKELDIPPGGDHEKFSCGVHLYESFVILKV